MAVGNFRSCLDFTLKWEGGFTNDPRDNGGPTNFGITQSTLSLYFGRKASVTDVQLLSKDTAAEIYRKKYWNVIDGDRLAPGVDLLTFDIAVNNGTGRALTWLRETASMRPQQQIEYLDMRRRSFWQSLKTWAVFGRGWSRRETECFALANAMLKGSMK